MSRFPLLDALAPEAADYDAFQLVRLLEWMAGEERAVGRDASPAAEAVRFQPHLSLAFPTSGVHALDPTTDVPRLTVTLFGLYGAQGVLPRPYTSLLLERARRRDPGLKRFLDIFNHRLIAHLVRANERSRYLSVHRHDATDAVTRALFALLGRAEPAAGEAGRERPLLRYIGLFSQRPRSSEALVSVLTDAFDGTRFAVEPFVGRWVPLPEADQCRLAAGASSNRLGRTSVAGARIFDRQGKFRLVVGPLRAGAFAAFQPDGASFAPLCGLCREFVGHHLHFDILPLLDGVDVPPLRLARDGGTPARLGRNTWLVSGERPWPSDVPARGAAFEADRVGGGFVHAA